MAEPVDELVAYHERSKHRINKYAPGPGRLDWANQPDPFRTYRGAPEVQLTLAADALPARYNDLRRGTLPASHDFDLDSLGVLFELSLGLSAWKSHGGNRWALRCNPSSGNLHPTEGYLVVPALPGLAAGVYHYLSRDHRLEHRAAPVDPRWEEAFASRGVIVGLASIHWREAWKYGMRAWRYCQHDCGHAIAAVSYAAAALGWHTELIFAVGDDTVSALLGLGESSALAAADREAPEALLWIGAPGAAPNPARLEQALAGVAWQGRANTLSPAHVAWPDIDAIQRIAHKPPTAALTANEAPVFVAPDSPALDLRFATLARQRRSAVDFDGETRIGAEAFYAMLDCLAPRRDRPPWNAAFGPPRVHLALMVHRVDALDAGLYVLVRNSSALDELRSAMRSDWVWKKCGPAHLPLYLLLPLDLGEAGKWVSCHQDIGRDATFALGMIADFRAALREPWRYRHLYWECGVIGQVLYLEAEAAGVRATGIGCFFDDEMHALLGLANRDWQSLYHFTVGGPVDDPRLSTLPPYAFQP